MDEEPLDEAEGDPCEDHFHYPEEVTALMDNMHWHLSNCFPVIDILQTTMVAGHAVLIEDGMQLHADETICSWQAVCRCGWEQEVTMQDNIPAWEELPDTEGGDK